MTTPSGVRSGAAHYALPVFSVVLTLALHACRDLSLPTEISPTGPNHSLNPSGTITVLPDSLRGWGFYNDQNSTLCIDATVCKMVQGPTPSPLGDGSAELATTTSTEGKAPILVDYKGTRLDRITTLSYSTFRQSADAGNNLAIALQLNADFDLTDAVVGYQGRLVFEPYHGNSGGVARDTWRTWNARTGKWWSTRATVPRNGVNVANPCVQATPCTWSQLLTSFPNVGIHATYGAVVLKAGSGWTAFRGNVDNVTIGIDGSNTTFDFELSRKLIGLAHECGKRFRVTNRTTTALTVTWQVRGTTDSAIVTVPARNIDSASASAVFTTSLAGMTVISATGAVVDSAANTGTACTGYRLRVLADDGVVFGTALSRDTIFSPGALVPFSLSPAAGRGTLVTVLDDTLAALSGTLVMDRDHTLLAETESPVVASAAVTDLGNRIRAVHASNTPAQALLDLFDWYRARADQVGSDVLAAQLDTAQYFLSDSGPDGAAFRQFAERVGGTEFLMYPLSGGGIGSYFMTPEDYGYSPGTMALRAPNPGRINATRLRRMRQSAGRGVEVPSTSRASHSITSITDNEPDEATDIIYVNGIWTTEMSSKPDAGSAIRTMQNLSDVLELSQRFGLGGDLRSNVIVTYFYNKSMLEEIEAWKTVHRCEASYYHGAPLLKPLHSLKRLAVCKGGHFLLWVMHNDVLEAARQVAQIQLGIGAITEDARRLAFTVRGHHESPANVIMVGHSQGNLLISQALSKLPSIEQLPINVGDRGCTAVLTLASPIARAAYRGIDPNYVRGLIVEGDVLMQFGMPNDFDLIHTPAGDSISRIWEGFDRVKQGLEAHYVDKNYLKDANSAARVVSELTALSDECSAGSFTISPNPITLAYAQTMRITPDIRNRAGRQLIGRSFSGGPLGLNITTDSIATAYQPTNGPVTGQVTLKNTTKVFATIQANVPKPAFAPSLTVTKNSWWETTFYSGPLGGGVEKSPPNWDGRSTCYLTASFSNATAIEDVVRRCSLTVTADIVWANFPGIRSISLSASQGGTPEGGAIVRDSGVAASSGLLLSCSDNCLNNGYIIEYIGNGNRLVTADTVSSVSFSRIPTAVIPTLRHREWGDSQASVGTLTRPRTSLRARSGAPDHHRGGVP